MRFNLSEWALRNRPIVLFAILMLGLLGAWSYKHLGQSEDPPFTFKAMVVRTIWPGATAEEVSRQITDRIEKKLMETGQYEFIRAYSRPGESQIIFIAKDSLGSKDIPPLWYQVRKKVGDIKATLPRDAVGPFFNDEFGDTFGNIYALTGDGFDYAVLKDYAERLELELQRVPDVGKVDLLGLQDEKIFIELSNTKLASLGIPLTDVQEALDQQNAVVPASYFETAGERVQLRVSGRFDSVQSIRDFPIRSGDRTFRLGEIATVTRGFSDPPAPRMRFMGEDAIGLAVSMRDGGDILKLGKSLETTFARLQKTLPTGMQLRKVSDQPLAVTRSVDEFIKVLTEAVAIVLLVSFLSLGLRTGTVVALSIPLVLAMTFAAMHYFGIGLHKISLGALVLALGLLVDDAIIAVEMMVVKIEQGYDRIKAAAFAWESTAFPMLTGTLVTAAGFLPIATAASSTGEYTRSIFQVVTIALLISWVAAVVFIPYLGYQLLEEQGAEAAPKGRIGRGFRRLRDAFAAGARRIPRVGEALSDHITAKHHHEAAHDPYRTPFYQRFRRLVAWCVQYRKTVIAVTVVVFIASLALFRFVPQQFFPSSTRLELMVDSGTGRRRVAQGHRGAGEEAGSDAAASSRAWKATSAYVGNGSRGSTCRSTSNCRRRTSPSSSCSPTTSNRARSEVRQWLDRYRRAGVPGIAGTRHPPGERPAGRLSDAIPRLRRAHRPRAGDRPPGGRQGARQSARDQRQPGLERTEQGRAPAEVDQERARALGVSSAAVAKFLSGSLSGTSVSTYREGNEAIEILLRGPGEEARTPRHAGLAGGADGERQGGAAQPDRDPGSYGFEDG
jgi:multidrug efflux pump